MMHRRSAILAVLVVACTPGAPPGRPSVDPAPVPGQMVLPPPPGPASGPDATVAPVPAPRRSLPPVDAFRAGMMPLGSSGIPRFAAEHPAFDGRGVLIAILDSGIDPSVPGLQTTSEGLPKLLDLRDFSGEGRIALEPIERHGDTLMVRGHRLLGAARVAALADGGRIYGGLLEELPLGEPPAADINGNGTVGDSLPLVVVRNGSGWTLFADTQGNGTLSDDRPIRDYGLARESFGWSMTNRPAPVTVAANLSDSAGVPLLDLFFDTSDHGTHVAGIAAGHDLYGVPGFDGVAPGARLIGLKIANDAHGGVTTSGSMVAALAYAIRFARERQLPLVANLSFGVGNEAAGMAHIDAQIDSILTANPDVVMTVAGGNDGPGLSTIGFPGSSARVLAIGATDPAIFAGQAPHESAAEPVAPYSSRGGELAAPDFVVPGTGYSSIPNFAIGREQQSGTSMATPYAAGLAARLLSGLVATRRHASAAVLGQALRVSARRPAGTTAVDAGAGIPDITSAWNWLSTAREVPRFDVEVGDVRARGAVLVTAPSPESVAQLTARVAIHRRDTTATVLLRLLPSEAWVHVPPTLTVSDGRGEFTVRVDVAGVPPGVRSAVITLDVRNTDFGPLVELPVTVRVPLPATSRVASQLVRMVAGNVARVIIPADSGRGMQIEVATALADAPVTASLHEPGGMPFRDGATLPAGNGDGAALFDIGANDVDSGSYELDVIAGPLAASAATVTVRRAPVRLMATRRLDTLHVSARNVVSAPVTVRLRAGLAGAERRFTIRRADDVPQRVAIAVPSWAVRVQVDSRMPRSEWPRFTDFSLAFQDRFGRQFAASPLDYAFGRTAPELPTRVTGDSLIILLSPAFATRESLSWQLDLNVRFYAERVVSLDEGGGSAQTVAPGKVLEQGFHTGPFPLTVPQGFAAVIIVLAQEGEDTIWMREIALQGGTTP